MFGGNIGMTEERDKLAERIMTSIRISKRNKERIYAIGSMGKTVNEVVDEILTFYEENH